MNSREIRRVVIVGTSGSGKTTLARRLAKALNVPHIELDALHWEPNWTSTPLDRLRIKVSNAIEVARDGWVVCGHYRVISDEFWPQADTIIWLDYPMSVVAWRVFARTMRRCWTGEQLWGGCRERLSLQFFSRNSLFLWVINTWRIRRRDYPKDFQTQEYRHLRVLRFRHPRETDAWFAQRVT